MDKPEQSPKIFGDDFDMTEDTNGLKAFDNQPSEFTDIKTAVDKFNGRNDTLIDPVKLGNLTIAPDHDGNDLDTAISISGATIFLSIEEVEQLRNYLECVTLAGANLQAQIEERNNEIHRQQLEEEEDEL